jgi:methionyl aminopeptidase
MSLIKTPKDLANIRIAGRILAQILDDARQFVRPGITTLELDEYIASLMATNKVKPSFLGFEGFPGNACLSVNDQVVHGIPGRRILEEGDNIGIDCGLWYEKICVDGAITVPVGSISQEHQRLLDATQEALAAGIKAAKPFRRIGAISQAIQEVAEKHGMGIVRTLTGHGVGHQVHEAPEIPNFGKSTDGTLIKPGMVLAIEPMFTMGNPDVLTEIDGWGVVTADRSLAAHFEHTVIITSKGAEVATKPLRNFSSSGIVN